MLSVKGIAALANSSCFKGIELLKLNNCFLDDEAMEALANDFLAGVRELHLNSNRIGDKGISALVNCECTTDLRRLEIHRNDFTQVGGDLIEKSSLANIPVLKVSARDYYSDEIGHQCVSYSRTYLAPSDEDEF